MWEALRTKIVAFAFLEFIFLLFFCSSSSNAQLPRSERNAAGTLINQDYFTANQYPVLKKLLWSVEKNHLDDRVLQLYAPESHKPESYQPESYKYALADIKYTLEKFPNHPKALMVMSSIARLTKALAMPIPYYNNALRFYPQYAITHAQYGNYLVEIGQVDSGIERLKQAIEKEPGLALAHAWLANAYVKKGDLELARLAAKEARKLGYKGELLSAANKSETK